MTDGFPHDPFWDWSLAIYGRPEVAPACLLLQERHGLDVNVLLFCCWAASRGERLTKEALRSTLETVHTWQEETVRPLRMIRRRMKGGVPNMPRELSELVRRRVAEAELDAEHLEQIVLSRHAGPGETAEPGRLAATAAANLGSYASVSGFAWAGDDVEPLSSILRAVAGDETPEKVRTIAASISAGSGS